MFPLDRPPCPTRLAALNAYPERADAQRAAVQPAKPFQLALKACQSCIIPHIAAPIKQVHEDDESARKKPGPKARAPPASSQPARSRPVRCRRCCEPAGARRPNGKRGPLGPSPSRTHMLDSSGRPSRTYPSIGSLSRPMTNVRPRFIQSRYSAVAVNNTSDEEFRAVSHES